MDDNVVTIGGKPLPPEVPYDAGLMDILERAITELKRNNVVGLAVVWITKTDESWDLDLSWQGPRLSLLAGATRLQHRLNLALDNDVRYPT